MVAQADVAKVPEILQGIRQEHRADLQMQLRSVWHQFWYNSTPVIQSAAHSVTLVEPALPEHVSQGLICSQERCTTDHTAMATNQDGSTWRTLSALAMLSPLSTAHLPDDRPRIILSTCFAC